MDKINAFLADMPYTEMWHKIKVYSAIIGGIILAVIVTIILLTFIIYGIACLADKIQQSREHKKRKLEGWTEKERNQNE